MFTTGPRLASEHVVMTTGDAVRQSRVVSTRRGLLFIGLVLLVALGSCLDTDAQLGDHRSLAGPCDVEPISINAGAERTPPPERTPPALTPSLPDGTIVWHCGTPDELPTVVALAAPFFRPDVSRAPPRG